MQVGLGLLAVLLLMPCVVGAETDRGSPHLKRARVYLAAGDYRRALEACHREIEERPSVGAYVSLTYVYHALDAYLEHLAKTDRWVMVEQAYVNLATDGVKDLTDPPTVLARMAKEIIQGAARQQSDVTGAMAARLDTQTVAKLWKQETVWRTAKPDGWWSGVPPEWGW